MTLELRVFGSSRVNGFRKSQGARSILWRNCMMRASIAPSGGVDINDNGDWESVSIDHDPKENCVHS